MEYFLASALVLGTVVLAACAFDLKKRMIPDRLNYLGTVAGVGFTLVAGKLSLEYCAFVVLSFVFAYLLYKLGVWAGGDVKFFTALATFFPIHSATALAGINLFFFALIFLYSAITAIPVMAIVYSTKVWRYRKEFAALIKKSWRPALSSAFVSVAIAFLLSKILTALQTNSLPILIGLLIAAALVRPPLVVSIILFAIALAFDPLQVLIYFVIAACIAAAALFCLQAFALVRSKVLKHEVATNDLREGMIPAKTILNENGRAVEWSAPKISGLLGALKQGNVDSLRQSLRPNGKIIADSRLARGLTEEEIKELKGLGINRLEIKESLPFAPILAAGYFIAVWLGIKWITG